MLQARRPPEPAPEYKGPLLRHISRRLPEFECSEEQSMPTLSADTRADLKLWLAVTLGGSGGIAALGMLGVALAGL